MSEINQSRAISGFEDKENAFPTNQRLNLNGSFQLNKGCGVEGNGDSLYKAEPKVKRSFLSYLEDATKSVQEDNDEKYAKNTQRAEVMDMAKEWMREATDRRVALNIQETLEAEEKLRLAKEIKTGESAALQIAVEERRRVKAAADAKLEIERKDSDFARQIVINEVDEDCKMKEICSADIDYAWKVQKELEDEILADEIFKREKQEHEERMRSLREIEQADAKLAEEEQALISKELERDAKFAEYSDLVAARELQKSIRMKENAERIEMQNKDSQVAKEINIKSARELHREKKYKEFVKSGISFPDSKSVAKQWQTADSQIENVENGICITLLLPHIKNLTIKIGFWRANRVELKAIRKVFGGDKSSSGSNTSYTSEYSFEGVESISQEDITYHYSSDTGLLHVYLECVQLGISSNASEKSRSNPIAMISRLFGVRQSQEK